MLEMYARSGAWSVCRNFTGKPPSPPLCWLKDEKKPAIKAWDFEGFYDGSSEYGIIWSFDRKRGRNDSFRLGAGYFSRNGDKLFKAFIKDKYKDDLRKACLTAKNFDTLYNEFEEWFSERRSAFMDKTMELIKQIHPDIKDFKQIKTNSHGGVANLLKVLTKTMHEQGSTIKTIAKTQYLVCIQAGVYLPEEFLTDVLVAEEIDENDLKNS